MALPNDRPPLIGVLAAFAAVYLVWGSTYLAIRIAVHDVPPGLLAGIRFIIAGIVLGLAAGWRGQSVPREWREWRVILIMAVTLIVIGNGFVTWAEQWVPSNQAALLIATSALWTAWFGTMGDKGTPLNRGAKLGLATGFFGAALLVWPTETTAPAEAWALAAILFSAVSWSGGMIYGRAAEISVRPLMLAALQMLVGGFILTLWGVLDGQTARVKWTVAGVGGLAYLTVFGSCIAYGSYIWLIRQTTPARLATIAYVNPAIATVLGWWLLEEALRGIQLAGMAIIIAGVALVAVYGRGR
ncbi:MAG: EamA family transporter [Gammaproteobacteria bacterium]|jgi:drug/metabolite transporter (DMT)-like permease